MHALVPQEGTVVASSGEKRPCMKGFIRLEEGRVRSALRPSEIRGARENLGCGAWYSFDKKFPTTGHQVLRLQNGSSGGERNGIYARRWVCIGPDLDRKVATCSSPKSWVSVSKQCT